MINQLLNIRERINIFLFRIETGITLFFRLLTLIASAVALIVFIIYYGFKNSPDKELIFLTIIKWSFFVYLMNYLVRWYYYKKFLKFIKEYAVETLLMTMFVLDNIFYWVTGRQLVTEIIISFGIRNYEPIYNLILQA
jgi:hypothetical protein